jgi:hypothetical protein
MPKSVIATGGELGRKPFKNEVREIAICKGDQNCSCEFFRLAFKLLKKSGDSRSLSDNMKFA